MVGTEFINGQGLGNQLFCYVTARVVAEENGYEFGTAGQERFAVNIHSDRGMYFMDMDLGKRITEEEKSRFQIYNDKEERLYIGNSRHDMEHGCYIAGADQNLKHVSDNTLIYGNMQDESYFIDHLDQVKQWLHVKPEYDSYEYSRDNLCIINMRGGEYTGSPELFIDKKYWIHGINIGKDYVTLKNAHYLLLSNSSFACLPAHTSETLKFAIAPKYWARHNVSDGYWASEQNIYRLFHYMDRKGNMFTAEECRKELEEYKKHSPKYRRINQKPGNTRRFCQNIRRKALYGWFYLKKIERAVIRRMKRQNGTADA